MRKPLQRELSASDAIEYVPAPTLRRRMGISAPTLWRWRRLADFPPPVVIRRRNYYSTAAIAAWIENLKRCSAAVDEHDAA